MSQRTSSRGPKARGDPAGVSGLLRRFAPRNDVFPFRHSALRCAPTRNPHAAWILRLRLTAPRRMTPVFPCAGGTPAVPCQCFCRRSRRVLDSLSFPRRREFRGNDEREGAGISGHGTPCPYGSHARVGNPWRQSPSGAAEPRSQGTAQPPLTRAPASTVPFFWASKRTITRPKGGKNHVQARRLRRVAFPRRSVGTISYGFRVLRLRAG